MIKKLKIKFIVIIMSLMTIVLLLIFGAINITMFKTGERQSINMMRDIAKNDGMMGFDRKPNQPIDFDNPVKKPTRQIYLSVKLNQNNECFEIISDKNLSLTQDDILSLVDTVLEKNKDIGKLDDFHYLIQSASYGKIIVFLDNSTEMNMTYRLLWTSLGIGIASLVAVFIISLFLSSWAIKPVKTAFEAQRQFVADASHELKTPLTIVATNADVLGGEIGENKWLGYIKAEAQRMALLVNDLLYLAKADSTENVYHMSDFDLSNIVMNASLPFESVAFESSKTLTFEIQEGIYYKGDESRIKQVVVILLDNAIKNANENGDVKVSLSVQSGKKVITVYNTGEGVDEEEAEKLFKRFYRGDSSRARETGGYGLGLSIAKTIVDAHKGKITIEGEKGKWVSFIVTL